MPRLLPLLVAAAAAVVAPVPAGADEATDRWVEFHRKRLVGVAAEGRYDEAAEDAFALLNLRPGDPEVLLRAIVTVTEHVCHPTTVFAESDPQVRLLDAMVARAISAGRTHDPAVAYALGRLYLARADHENAQQMLGLAASRGFDPVRARYWSFRAVLGATQTLLAAGRAELCAARLRRALGEMPDHPDALVARMHLANAIHLQGENAEAERMLREIVVERPAAVRARIVLAQVLIRQSRFDEAAVELREAIDRAAGSDDPLLGGTGVVRDALLWTATMEIRRGDLDAAERAVRQYSALAKDSTDEMILSATIGLRRGGRENAENAVRLLRRAKRLDRDRPEILRLLSTALGEVGETEEAAEVERDLNRVLDAIKARASGGGPRPAPQPAPQPGTEPPPR